MAGWHTRLWRRIRVAPGVTVNLSKSGPSLSVGPRGAKVTVGRRGIRQTVGIPGSGLFATRTITPAADPPRNAEAAANEPATDPRQSAAVPAPSAGATVDPSRATTVDYILVALLGLVVALLAAAGGSNAGSALLAGATTGLVGLAYEWLAHHHPRVARTLVSIVGGLIALAFTIAGAILVAALSGIALGLAGSGRRRRRHW
ncbi:MAG: DUF4236 domain-containing protein [Candidatus Limnocylindrales bacterium]